MKSIFYLFQLAAAPHRRLLADAAYHYTRPFIQPLPSWNYWYLLVLPLCAAVAIVYKSIRCGSMKRVPRESAVLFLLIVAGLLLAAFALAGLNRWME